MPFKDKSQHNASASKCRANYKASGKCRCGRQQTATSKSCETCKLAARKVRTTKKLRLKHAAISYYGGKCACCKLDDFPFLTIDHINNDGAVHRKANKIIGRLIYNWLKKNNYPAGFQVLCFNCNSAKSIFGVCPHQREQANVG